MADVAHVNTTTQTNTSASTTITVNVPTHSDGDLLIVYLCHAEAEDGDWTDVTSQGWTLQVTELQVGQTPPSIPGVTVATRYADSEPASYTFTNDFSSGLLAVMSAYSGVNSDTPMDATPTTAQSSSTGDPNSPSITTQTDAAVVISVGIADATGTLTAAPTNYTNRAHLNNGTGGNGHTLSVSDREIATAGAEDPGAYNFSQNEEWGAVTLAIANGTVTGIAPTTFDMDESSVTITGTDFNATQGSGTVYLSDSDTLAGSDNEVDIDSAISSWSDISISLNLGNLSASELIDLNRLGPGQRYLIVTTSTPAEFPSEVLTLHRSEAFVMSLSSSFAPSTTTAQLTAPATKTTGDMDGGRIEEAANPSATNTDVTIDDYREDEWCFKQKTNARNVSYAFRQIYTQTAGITYIETPYLNLSEVSGIKVRVADFSLRTTTGTQDITITDLGSASDIKGAIFFTSGATVLDTVETAARSSIGFTDKTDEVVVNTWLEDGQTVSDTRRNHVSSQILRLNDKATDATITSATVDSWITDGVRISVTQNTAEAYKGFVVFFVDSGTDLSIKVASPQMSTTSDVDVTTIGFEPEVVLAMSYGGILLGTSTGDKRFSFGAVHNTGGLDPQPQSCLLLDSDEAQNPVVAASYFSTSEFGGRFNNAATIHHLVEAITFDSSGLTLSPSATASTTYYDLFCISTGGKLSVGVDSFTGPTSASVDWVETSLSIKPQAVIGVQSAVTTVDSIRSTDEISSCFYAFDEDGNQASIGSGEDDGVTPSNTFSTASTANSIWVRADDQVSDFHLLGDPTIIPGGFEYPASEITTANGTGRYGFSIVFGNTIEAAVGDTEVLANTDTYTLTTYPATITLDVNVQAGTDTYTLTTYQAGIVLDVNVQAGTDTYTLTTYQAEIANDVNVLVNTDAYTLTTYQADISLGIDVQAGTQSFTFTEYQADIALDIDVQAGTDTYTLTTYQASIDTGASEPIVYVNGDAVNDSGGATTIAAPAINATAGNFIVVLVSNYTSGKVAVSSVTDTASNTYTRAGTSEGGDPNHTQDVWYAYDISGNAANVVTANFAASAAFRVIHALQYSGIDTAADPYDTESTGLITASGTTHTSNSTGTTTQADELIFGGGIQWAGGAADFTENDGTIRIEHSGGNSVTLDKIVSSTGAYTLAFDTDASDQYFFTVKTFKAASASGDTNVLANTDTYTLTTYPASISLDIDVQAGTDTYTLTTYQAGIALGIDVQVDTQAFTLTTYPASIVYDVDVQSGTDTYTLTTYPAVIRLDVDVQSGTQGFTLTTYQAEITLDVNIQANTQAFTLTTYQANIEVGDDVNIQANTQAFTLTTYQADITLDVNVLTNTQAFTLTTYPASLGLGTNIQANSQAFTLTTYPAAITLDVNVQADTQAFTLDTYQALVSSDRNVLCQTANFTLTTYQADIFAGTPSGTSEIITGRQMIADPLDTSFPIQLAVNESGGVPGLTVVVELRDMDATTFFLDFDDYIMKSSGWVSKSQALSDNGGGYYSTSIDVAGISGLTGNHMSVEYEISGSVVGVSNSLLTLDSLSIEGTYNLQESVRLMLASLAGGLSGAGTTTVTIRDTGDTKDRIIATVDSNGNRTPVTLDAS